MTVGGPLYAQPAPLLATSAYIRRTHLAYKAASAVSYVPTVCVLPVLMNGFLVLVCHVRAVLPLCKRVCAMRDL